MGLIYLWHFDRPYKSPSPRPRPSRVGKLWPIEFSFVNYVYELLWFGSGCGVMTGFGWGTLRQCSTYLCG